MFKKFKEALKQSQLEQAKTLLTHATDEEFGEFIEGVITYRRLNSANLPQWTWNPPTLPTYAEKAYAEQASTEQAYNDANENARRLFSRYCSPANPLGVK